MQNQYELQGDLLDTYYNLKNEAIKLMIQKTIFESFCLLSALFRVTNLDHLILFQLRRESLECQSCEAFVYFAPFHCGYFWVIQSYHR
jgi:hypothetical protein